MKKIILILFIFTMISCTKKTTNVNIEPKLTLNKSIIIKSNINLDVNDLRKRNKSYVNFGNNLKTETYNTVANAYRLNIGSEQKNNKLNTLSLNIIQLGFTQKQETVTVESNLICEISVEVRTAKTSYKNKYIYKNTYNTITEPSISDKNTYINTIFDKCLNKALNDPKIYEVLNQN